MDQAKLRPPSKDDSNEGIDSTLESLSGLKRLHCSLKTRPHRQTIIRRTLCAWHARTISFFQKHRDFVAFPSPPAHPYHQMTSGSHLSLCCWLPKRSKPAQVCEYLPPHQRFDNKIDVSMVSRGSRSGWGRGERVFGVRSDWRCSSRRLSCL